MSFADYLLPSQDPNIAQRTGILRLLSRDVVHVPQMNGTMQPTAGGATGLSFQVGDFAQFLGASVQWIGTASRLALQTELVAGAQMAANATARSNLASIQTLEE
jgi:hypothetical protein